ncbi:HNH endonuclease [bacterium]|nr:MAG: HNH endonuclease [bacterium]
MPLKLSVAKIESSSGHEKWRILDTTNPAVRWMTGEYDGEGKNANEALLNALSTMAKGGNRYPEGSIQVEIGSDIAGEKIDYSMNTTGQNALDTVIQILDTLGFWTGIGALLLTAIGAIAPIPGTRVATALLWASLLSSSAAASLSIYQRHKEGFGDGTEDAMDALTIFGNVLAGTWMAGGRVVTNKQWGIPMAKGLLIGQFSTDAVQGIILGDQYIEQYSSAMKIKDPDTRARALMEVIRSASAASAMLIISMRATKSDIELMSTSRRNLHSLGNPGEEFDLPKTEKLIKEERIRQGKEGPVKTESDQRRTEKDTNGVDKSKEREKYLSEQTTKEGVRLRNQHLAGKNHPVTGVPFDESGFPVFDDYLYKGGPNDVMIEPTGNDYFDFKAANEAAGYSRTPKGYTWHHHQNTGRMQLVDSKIHRLTGHTGGASIWYGDEKLK